MSATKNNQTRKYSTVGITLLIY